MPKTNGSQVFGKHKNYLQKFLQETQAQVYLRDLEITLESTWDR